MVNTNLRKRLLAILFTVILLSTILLTGCASNQKKIVGRWQRTDGMWTFRYLEFFSDGTYDSDNANYSGSYSIDGNRIRLSGILAETRTYTFEIKGNQLILYTGSESYYATYEKSSK